MRTEDIISRVFTRSFMGYDIEEVDRFLDEMIDVIEQYEAEKKEMMNAMAYLMQKIENDERPPAAEMRKAIDSGNQPKKRGSLPGRSKDVRIPSKRSDGKTSGERNEKPDDAKAKAARSITPGGSGTPRPVRAPKVKRVAAQQQTETEKEQPAQSKKHEDWLDELLDNLSERDRQGYTETVRTADEKADSTEAPDAQASTKVEPEPSKERTATQPLEQTSAEAATKQTEAQTPKQFEPETPKEQPISQMISEERPAAKKEPQQVPLSTEETIRTFEETLRTLGERIDPEAKTPAEDQQQTGRKDDEGQEHKPKHAAENENKKQ